jgi:hypothetical protein
MLRASDRTQHPRPVQILTHGFPVCALASPHAERAQLGRQ